MTKLVIAHGPRCRCKVCADAAHDRRARRKGVLQAMLELNEAINITKRAATLLAANASPYARRASDELATSLRSLERTFALASELADRMPQ